MFARHCIISFILTLLLSVFTLCVRAAEPVAHPPGRFTPDSARIINKAAFQRNQRLYDSIQSKTSRKAVPRALYRILFVKPKLDTTASGQVTDEAELLEPYAGKTIGYITIERHQVFDEKGSWLERTGNKLHALTRDRVIRRDLFLKSGDAFDPELVVRNKQLLRSRSYIADVEVKVLPDELDSTRVNLVIVTRDSWTISADGALHSEGRTMAGLYDANIFGTGNRLKIMTNFNRNDFSYGGNMVEYEIPNLLGTFYEANFAAGKDFYNSTLDVSVEKEFLRPTDYELGISYSNIKEKIHMIEQDTSELVKQRNFDIWGGYSHFFPGIESSLFFTGHYNYRRMGLRPKVASDFNPAFHEQDVLLVSTGLYRERFYSANMFYGFGVREYLATGYKAELTSGYTWGEYYDGIYLGASCQAGGFRPFGYIMGNFTFGSYIDPQNGMWRSSAIDIDLRWFSNLMMVRRSRIRQFLSLNYTQGWNRTHGNDESIRFTTANGLQMLDESMLGTNRMILNTETVLFTPYQPLGFRIAFFGFADFGLIGYSPNIFKNDFVSTLGVGVRLRNERLVFNALQIRVGVALGKKGLLACDYFDISNYTRLAQYRYRPTRSEVVPFQ
ncbi:MAG TPA: hypothetical protein H9879_08940 [Candidatus Alistipes intestinipullorum]|nr:hypothetical protein [Candidatus Alistipes intestinipullorum]